MPGIDAKELIWRAYTANPASLKDKAQKIISYAENQEVGRQLFLKSRLWKDFEFNKQTKQWETRFVQEGLKAWVKFKTPAAASQHEQDAERMVEQEIRDRFFSEIKQAQEMSQREESILHEYLKNTSKEKLLNLLNKIQDKGILSYYEHSKKQELKLIQDKNDALQERKKYSVFCEYLKKIEKKVAEEKEYAVKINIPPEKRQSQIQALEERVKYMDSVLVGIKELQKALLNNQLEVYFNFENSGYFGVEIPVQRLQEFLILEEQKLAALRQEKNRLEAEIASSKEKKSEQTESAEENLFKKNQEMQEITKHIKTLENQIITMDGDIFTSLLEKSNEETTLFANRDLTPQLFSMINNDAWLINSSFQGGDPAETASIFLELIQGISGDNTDPNIVELEKVIKQIQENGKQISECVRAGKLFEAIKNTSPEEMYKKFELIENDPWGKNKFSDIKERLEDTVYIEKFNDFNQLTYIAHYYDGAQWCASPKTKWTEPANRLKAPKKKIKKGYRRKMGDSDSDFDFDFEFHFDADISAEQKPIESDIKEIISSFGLVKDLKEKKEHREKEHERKGEDERLALIKSLAIHFQSQINSMSTGESFFFPGGFFKHAMLYEFKKENNGEMSLIVYNTGAGSQYHEHQTTFYQGVFKRKHFPAYVYRFPVKKTEEVAFQDYLSELLKVNVASSWEKISSNPDIKSVAKKSNEKDLYQHILPLVTHLGGRRIDPKTVVTNPFITGQRSGKCSEAVFHPIIRSKLGAKKYQRFMCAYRKETIAQFVRAQGQKGQLSNPVIQRQIRKAVSNLSKRLYKNQRVFTPYERASVAKFVAEINQKLELAVQSHVVDGLIEPSVSLQERVFQAEKLPSVKANVSNIDTEIKQDLMREKKDEPKKIAPLLACEAQDTPQILIEKMESVLSWAEKALSEKTTNHREIVLRIEKILMTWPLGEENLDISIEQKNKIVENIKKIMNIYSQQSLLQFGVNLDQKLPQLLPQHIMTLLSALAIVAQTASGQEAICIKELMSTCGISTVLQKNEFNPYLASTEFQCDARIQELLQFFNQFTTDMPSIKDIYAKLIEEDPEQKKCLLIFYDKLIGNSPGYKGPQAALRCLSEVEKCILVLCRCKVEIESEPRIKEVIRKFDSLVNIDNMQAVLGKMLSEKIQNDSNGLLKTLSAKDLTFIAEEVGKGLGVYRWNFETPSLMKLKGDKVSVNSDSVGKSKREIQDKAIASFFKNDVNHERELLKERHVDNDVFRSSKIQVGKSGDGREVITAEEFYFKQFCHTRSSVDGQVLSTINFFQDNTKLLCDNKWQTVCECNLFQPSLLLKALKETPSACDTLYTFLRKGLIENIEEGVPNAAGLFFIKMQISLNNYLIESQSEYAKSSIENLEILNHALVEMIKKTKDDTLRRQLYYYQTSLIGRLMPHVADEKKTVLIQNYLKARLSGTVSGVTADLQNPLDFMTQENICFNMSAYLIQHSEQVAFVCADKLKELEISQDVKSIFDYPNIFYPYSDSAGQHLIAINLESGQILNDGKQLLPLPKILFNNQQFVELFGDSVEQAFHCMLPGDREPSVYEIKKDGNDYWIQKNSDGYVFQKNIISTERGPQRYQLIPYESLGDLNRFIPKTLIDNNHRFWISINEPKELRIEEKGSKQEVCRITDFNTEAGYIESAPFKIWTQQQTATSFLGEKFSCFENSEFVEVRELQSAFSGDAVLNQPLYIIKLPRYQLTFHVMKIDPLVIYSINPEGTLLLSETLHDLANIKNALFVQKKSGDRIALLPRQYFVADKSIEEGSGEVFEYTPVRLDTQNKHQDLVVTQKNSEKKYCKQSEFLECPLDTNGKMIAKNGADALYLAYVHLANFDPESALSILQACEKSGGIKGTQKEIENLMLMFTSLPATSEEMEDVSQKMIDTPEFIAVKAYALYLYASAKYKETDREFVEPLNADGKCFYAEAKGPKDKLQGYLNTFLTKYQSIKNKIPIEMQLTTQQELECLNLSNDPLLILQRDRLLAENLQKQQVTAFDPNQQKAAKIAQGRLLEGDVFEEQSQYLIKSCHFQVIASEDKTPLLNAIDLPRTRNNTDISGKTIVACVEQYSSNKKIEMAIQQLDLNLDLKEFFKYFLTYYHIATSKDPLLTEEKNKLKEFLACKLRILGNEHPLYGQELIMTLYKILEGTPVSLKSVQEFLEAIRGNSSYSYSHQVEGYVFNKDSFYAYLIEQFKDLTVTLEVEGVKEEVPLSEQKKLVELLDASSEPLTKARNYTPPRLLSYPQGIDILEKYHLQSMRDIAKMTHSAIFLAGYKQLAFSGDAAVATVKRELKNKKEQLRKAEEKLRNKKTENKELVEGKDDISLLSFENFASQELLYEKKIGRVKNKTVQKQVELATQYFSIKEQKEAVHKAVKNSLDSSKQCKDKLLSLIKEMVNQGPASQESNRLHQLALQGKIRQDMNEQMILNLYLLGDEKSFIDATGLPPDQVPKVYSLITEYLFVATHGQQLENIDKKLTELKDIKDKDKPFAFENIANLLAAENSVDPATDPAALSVFQFCGEALLRPEQVAYLRSHVKMTDNQFKDLMSQLIMGFGKTFLLPIIAKAKATGNNLSVIEVPDPLFDTNVTDLNNASMRFLNQKTKSLRFNRNTSCNATDLKALYDWLVEIKHNRDYLVTTGESVASINLRYVEILKSIATQQSLIAAIGEAKVSAELEEVKVLAELTVQAHWLEKIVKLFKFEADAIIDEVHSSLNVRKKLIYSLGMEGIDQKEISAAIKLYEFSLPLQVYQGHTVEEIIKNPGIIPPGKEELWKAIMEKIAEKLRSDENSPILGALTEVGNTELVKKYLLNELDKEQTKTIETDLFLKLSASNKNLLSLYKAELTRLLPSALKKENGKHYGILLPSAFKNEGEKVQERLLAENQLLNQPCAVPFIASDTPHILSHKKGDIRTTHFANPDETINYTIQAYVSKGLPDFMVRSILEKLKAQAKLELMRDNKATYDLTETGKLFRELINEETISLDNFDKDTERLKRLIEKLQQEKSFIFYALEHHILPTLKVEQSTLEHNSNQRAYLYRTVQGIGGTTDNYRSIARMEFDQEKYMGTNGVTIDHIVKKVGKADVKIIDNSEEDLVLKLLKSNTSKENLTHAIIDVGGLFTGVTNLIVAQKIADYFKGIKEEKRKYILFFNEKNQFCAINVNDPNVPKDIIVIGSTEKSAIKKALNNCQEDEWFTYYDQLHTEGTDVLQSSSAKASITFSYDTTLPKFSQGAMRMRGLAKDQRLEIFMEKHILQSCFKAPLLNEIMDFLNKQDEPLKIEKIVGLLNENYEPSKVEKIIDFLNKQDEPLKTDIIKTEIIDFLNKNDDPPKVEKIMDFLDQNEVAALSEEHLRFVLQEMDNTLFQELLLILLENESESDDPGQQRRKAEMLNIINTNSSLFLKKRVGSLFERYGAVETKDAELKSVLEEKQKSLIELRSKLLAKISFKDLVDEQKADKFNGTLSTLVEQGIKNCKAIVLFRENFDQDAEAEAETEAETDAESELEADLEVSKVKQEPYRTACGYRIWICNAIDSLRENIDQFDQLEEDIVPLSNMLQSVDTVNTGYIELDPRLYISKNHVRMYTEQHDLFNDSRMPIQDVLMFRDSKGTLHALIITPNEKQELMTSKKDIFKGQDPQMWIESSTGVVVYAGTRPPEVEKDLKYLKIQEQIKFMNGDMKSLLMQDKYVWLPRHLENKKTLLSTKILTNRPEQVEYTGKLLTRVKQLRAKYEQVAIQLLRGVPARTAAESCFTVVTVEDVDKITKISGELLNVDEILKLRAESKEDECVVLSACKLVATFQDCPIDSKLLHELYPAVDNDSISCLSYAYAAKKVLLQLHDTKRPVQASKKRDKTPVLKNQFSDVLHELKILSSTKQDILKKLLMEGVVGNDPELITVIFKAFPDVLNEMTGDLHPVSFAMKNRDYLRLTDLLEQHFAAEKREPENALWIQTAFSDACKNKEIKFLKILIEKSGSLNLPLELVEKIIVALSENEQDDLLKMFFEKCVFQESLEPAKKLKEKYEHLVKALKTNISGMILLSSLTLDIYGNNTQSKDFKYIFEQPNFTIVSKGITQLMMACQEGSLTDYKQLIENGANVFHKAIPQKNVYPSYDPRASAEYDVFAYAVGGGNKEIIKDLLRRENVIESLSLDSIKGVLLQLIVNDKKFDSEFVYEIVQTLIARASLSEKSGKLANELSSLFSYAVKNNNFILAKKLIQTTDPKKISSVCSFSSILETLKLMQTNSEPLNPELVDCFLVALEKIPLEEKLKDSKFVAELQGGICELLKKGDTHHAKRILDAMNAPTFNATFLDRFIQPKHYADLLPHLALIKELSKNISSIIVENKNLGENKPLLSDFMEILNQAPDLDSKENLESISVINEIISALVNGKDTLEIFRFKSKWSSRMQHSQPLLLLLLKHAARNSHNQNCILDVLNEHYPGNLELDYTVYVAEERREKNVNENLLLWAIKNNFKELVELLLEKGARLSDVMPKCRKSGFELLCGTPAYIDKLTPEQLKLLGSVLEKENLVETLAADKYLSYLQVAISQKIENPATYTPIRHLDMGLVSQLMRFSADYEKNLPEEIRQSTFGTFIQTAVNAISYQNDILEVCHTLLEHPVFKKNFSEQQFVKIKDNLLDWNQYRGDAVRGQRNLELLSKILEKTPIEQNDFPKFVECCCRCPQVEQKSEDNHRGKILDLFIQKFTIDQLLSSTDEIVEQLNKLPDDLFEKIIDASIEQSKSASKEEQEIIRVKMLNMLNFLVKKGSNHKIKNFLSKSVDMLRLDKEQKENILFNLVQYNGECKLDNILEEIVEMLDVRSVLADESKKEHLVKLSIENYNSHVFFDYLLSKGYVDKVSPIILDAMIERRHGVDVSAITKFLKKSMGVEALLTAMYVKHTAQVQAQKQQEMGSFGSPAKPATIISQFITYQLSNVNNSIGEPIFQQLAEKIGLKMIEETIKTGLSVESAKKNKNKPVIQEKLVPLQISDTKKDEAELILQEFERKKGLRVVGEAMEEIITNYRSYGRTKNILLEITKFPTLCESILEYYAVKNFSELRGKPIYDSLARNLEAKALEEFAAQFDQAVTNVRQGRRPQV